MNSVSKHALGFLIGGFLICFILLYAALFIYHERNLGIESTNAGSELLRGMRESYSELWLEEEQQNEIIFKTGLALRFALIHTLRLLPALAIFLFIMAFSVLYTLSPFHTETFMYHSVAIPSYFTLISFIVLIILSELLFIPILHRDSESIIRTSQSASAAYRHAEELKERGDLKTARSVIEIYLEMDPKSRKALELHNAILEGIYRETFETPDEQDEVSDFSDGTSSFDRGKIAFSRGDYYTALFYFERALSVQGENRAIREYYQRAKDEVDRLLGSLTRDESIIKRYIEQKEKAISALERGNFYSAHEILAGLLNDGELRELYPELLEDVKLYHSAAAEELQKIDFLPAEILEYTWLPSFDSIVFTDSMGFVNTVARVIPWNNQIYFLDITRYRIEEKRIIRSRRKYGKWMDGRIRLKNSEEYRRWPSDREEFYNIKTELHPGYILYFNDGDRLLNQMTVYERFALSDSLRRSGFDIEDKYVYLARKMGIFFSVYVLSLFLAGIAWSKRSIYEFPPAGKLILFIIVIPLFGYLLHRLYLDTNSMFIYSHRYTTRYVFKNINVALYTGAINMVISAIATIYYLSQRSSVE